MRQIPSIVLAHHDVQTACMFQLLQMFIPETANVEHGVQ